MKITANISYRGFSLTSVDAKTLKMQSDRYYAKKEKDLKNVWTNNLQS